LATNATRRLTEFELGLLNIDYKTFFDAILIAEEFGVGKPNPDMYLELARRLNLDRNQCIIFEDSISGVRAAVAAQIKCIGILTSGKKETLEQHGTWRTINNFDEVDLDEIWNTLQEKK
jgi:beta-phosphoglucomutase-like phosphatase (HAD superfamily)